MTRSQAEVLAYLGDQLGADPSTASESIVLRRALFLNAVQADRSADPVADQAVDWSIDPPADQAADQAAETSADLPAIAQEREQVRVALASLQRDFHNLAPESFAKRVAALGLDSAADLHPDLAAWLERMRRFDRVREDFTRARSDPAISARLLDGLAEIAISREEDAVSVRQKVLESMRTLGAKRAAKKVQRLYPDLHALESEWFGRIHSLKRDRKLATRAPMTWTGLFVFWLFVGLVRYCSEH